MARDLRLQISGDSRDGQKALDGLGDEAAKTARKVDGLGDEFKGLGAQAKVAAAGVDKAAAEMREAARSAAKLDAALAGARVELGKLNREFGETGEAKTLRALEKQYAELDRISRLKKRIGREDTDRHKLEATLMAEARKALSLGDGHRGGGFGASIIGLLPSFVGELLGAGTKAGGAAAGAAGSAASGAASAGPYGVAAGVGLGALGALAAGPFIGGVAGGATLLGGAGLGAGLGLAGAWMGDPEKYGAKWNASIDRIQKRWIDSSAQFAGPLEDSLNEVDRLFRDLPVERLANASKGFVEPLVQGAGGGITELASGFADFVEAAQPVVDVVGPELVGLGRDIGDSLRAIGLGSEGGAQALGDLINGLGYAVKATGVFVGGLEKAYEVERRWIGGIYDAATAMPVLGDATKAVVDGLFHIESTTITAGRELHRAGDAAHDTAFDWGEMAEAGARAALETLGLNDALTKTRNTMLGMANANLAVAQGWLDLKDELKDGAKSLDTNTQAGVDNQKAIIAQALALEQQRQKAIELGKDTPAAIAAANAANAAYEAGIQKIREMAHAANFTDAQVDEMLRAYGLIPPVVSTQIITPGLSAALAEGYALGYALEKMNGRHYYATVDVSYQGYNPGIALGNLLHHARGGEMATSGPKVVGEHGRELVWGSRGQYVSTAEETRKLTSMMGSATGPGSGGGGVTAVAVSDATAATRLGPFLQWMLDSGALQFFDSNGGQVRTRRG